MRHLLQLSLAVSLLAGTAVAQSAPPVVKVEKDHPAGHSMEHMSGWRELDAYHMVMMRVWHPAKEKSDLKPIRAEADALVKAADTWAKAGIPKECDTPENRAAIQKVQSESVALAALVKAGSDKDVMASLKALHDRFEVVNKSCKVKHHD